LSTIARKVRLGGFVPVADRQLLHGSTMTHARVIFDAPLFACG
jgi:hypothetical protein